MKIIKKIQKDFNKITNPLFYENGVEYKKTYELDGHVMCALFNRYKVTCITEELLDCIMERAGASIGEIIPEKEEGKECSTH